MEIQRRMAVAVKGIGLGIAIALLASCTQSFVSNSPVSASSPAVLFASVPVAEAPAVTPAPSVSPGAPVVEKEVPYVVTPNEVVAEMLKVARVTDRDQLYDLGSGDGRIVLTAAQKYGTRGVGVELDPKLIQESNASAQKAGLGDRVKFLQQDLFQTNLRDATVVTLYLLPAVNLKLQPKLLNELKPGSRVVSHAFDLGDWKPDKTLTVKVPKTGRIHAVYYWVVPAQVAGNWQGTLATPLGRQPVNLLLRQQFQQVTGAATAGNATLAIRNAKLTGNQISFTTNKKVQGQAATIQFAGRVEGNTLKGIATVQGAGLLTGKYNLVAQRR
ncbi:cyclopropane-fatty-acyl-phospholipid synthase family protein [Trichocoleus sp. FACHB-262]|uniref:SAM-dependent methyltransferase n=1 Tax=Trichocoleus sp. FACHB-262 TaxID=2692869 RepID=UPI0016896F2B|nr:class I SAM-dependent methyltransferase [Trichocoleus sp. FACHB-262]MBD2120119.1 class I SAM-dependent methyltransferase [Trichocoleus sp. FACHB-262]